MGSRALPASLFVALLLLSLASDSLASASSNGRSLLRREGKKEKEAEAEAEREAEALKAYEKEQRKRDEERIAVIENAQDEAEEEVAKFNKASDEEEQIDVFVDLWRDARGPTLLVVMTTLISSNFSESYLIEIVAASMLEADSRGFSFQISDALWAALTLVENEEDGEPLLDAIAFNQLALNEEEKGSGCTYVKNLFTDAEVLAIENGYEVEFTRAFDDPEYLNLAECFYEECSDAALECCGDEDAVASGRCGCRKKEPNICDFNLFLNTPRPIWRCSGEECFVTKCLCPDLENKKKSKGGGKKKGRGKNRSKNGKSKNGEEST